MCVHMCIYIYICVYYNGSSGKVSPQVPLGIQVMLFEGSCGWTANSMTILTREVFFFPQSLWKEFCLWNFRYGENYKSQLFLLSLSPLVFRGNH